MLSKRHIRQLLLCAALLLFTGLATAEQYRFTAIENNPYQASLAEVMKEAFHRLGHELQVDFLPGKRALYMSNSGRYDGEIGRVSKTSQHYTNLTILPVAIGRFEGVAISNTPDERFIAFEQFKPHPIAVINGTVWASKPTEVGYLRSVVTSYATMFRLFEGKRIDYALGDRAIFQYYKERKGFQFHFMEPPIVDLQLFPHLHKSREHLYLPLTEILQEMKQNGDIDRIRDQKLFELLDQ